jgi:hypothetical protein
MRQTIEIIIAVVGFIALMAVLFLIMWAQGTGAKRYIEDRGYQVETFEQGLAMGSCYISKDRMRYNFTATKDGRPVKGYVCYGGVVEAAIHEETT